MSPVILADDNIIQNEYSNVVSGSDIDDNDKTAQKPGFRRDSDGSTGYSTCSSNLSSVSQHHEDRSPRSPDSEKDEERKEMTVITHIKKASHVEEEENDGDVETNNDDDENRNDLEISKKSDKHLKLSPVDFVNQICANQRCLSAGYKGKKKEKEIRRGSNGYNTAVEVKNKQVTPESLGEAITTVINKLEDNIKDLKYTQDETIKHLKDEQENKFLQFTFEQEKTLRKINQNIVQAEAETLRIKKEHDTAIEMLQDNILNVSNGSKELIHEKESMFNEKQEDMQQITQQHESYIKNLTKNLDKISRENKESVTMLLVNLDKAKKEKEKDLDNHNKSLNELREFQEKSIIDMKNDLEAAKHMSENFKTQIEQKNLNFEEENLEFKSKLAYHDTAIKALEKNNEMHLEIAETNKKSLGELRQEVFSQVMVVKEISRSVQEEFNDKLENITKILNDEKFSNKEKIEEVREALDGIDIDIRNKMKETTDNLLDKIHEEVKQNGGGKYSLDLEISVVKVTFK